MEPKTLQLFDSDRQQLGHDLEAETAQEALEILSGSDPRAHWGLWINPEPACERPDCNMLLHVTRYEETLEPVTSSVSSFVGETLSELLEAQKQGGTACIPCVCQMVEASVRGGASV